MVFLQVSVDVTDLGVVAEAYPGVC